MDTKDESTPNPNQGTKTPDVNKEPSLDNNLRQGLNQFNPMPRVQQFTPPPPTAGVAGAQIPTQTPVASPVIQTQKKSWSVLKITLLIVLLLVIAIVAVLATLVATDYQIYSPPEPIKNLLEKLLTGNLF